MYSISRPKLSAEVLALSNVIEFNRSLLFALFNTKAFVLPSVPPPLRVRVFAPKLTAAPEYVSVLLVSNIYLYVCSTDSVLLILLMISSASRVPPLIAMVEASVPGSLRFNEPAVTPIAPDRLLPEAIDTGVI